MILFGLEGVSDQMTGSLGGSIEMMNLRENSKVGERERDAVLVSFVSEESKVKMMNYVCFDLL